MRGIRIPTISFATVVAVLLTANLVLGLLGGIADGLGPILLPGAAFAAVAEVLRVVGILWALLQIPVAALLLGERDPWRLAIGVLAGWVTRYALSWATVIAQSVDLPALHSSVTIMPFALGVLGTIAMMLTLFNERPEGVVRRGRWVRYRHSVYVVAGLVLISLATMLLAITPVADQVSTLAAGTAWVYGLQSSLRVGLWYAGLALAATGLNGMALWIVTFTGRGPAPGMASARR